MQTTVETEIERLIDRDDFYLALDGNAEDIECRLKDKTKKADLEWEIDGIRSDLELLNREERRMFKAHCVKNYPRMAKVMGWKVA